MKHEYASLGLHTIGSPLTLKEVFNKTGQLVRFLKEYLVLELLKKWN